MATVNLLTGTAHGKLGVLQYQTHGLKCVVRSKQPGGLTNPQAEDINKPVLKFLSAQYHLWAKYLLSKFATDWKKPQAVWNYFTEVNKPSFTDGVTPRTGWSVNKHAGELLPAATYFPNSGEGTGRVEFSSLPPLEYLNYDVLLVFGLDTTPIELCQKIYAPYNTQLENLPYIEVIEDTTKILGFIVSKDHKKLISGAFNITAGPDAGVPFWNAPANFIDGGIVLNYTTLTSERITAAVSIDEEAVPDIYEGFKWRFTFVKNLGNHAETSAVTILRNATLPVTADCEVWNTGEILTAIEILDPAETTICSPVINLLSRFVRPAAASFGVGNPSGLCWTANTAAKVTLSYVPVLAPIAAPLPAFKETLTFTRAFGGIAPGTEIAGLFKTPYTQGNITGTPPLDTVCAQSDIYDTRTNALVCTVQNVNADRQAVTMTASELAALLTIYQTGLLYLNIATTLRLGTSCIPIQYQDCVFKVNFIKDVGGITSGATLTAGVTSDTALTAGQGFPASGASVADAVLFSTSQNKNLSPSFTVKSGFEVLQGNGKAPFWITIKFAPEGETDIEYTLHIETPAYKNISYYPGDLTCHLVRDLYDCSTLVFEGIDEDEPIAEGAICWSDNYEGGPYTGPNGTADFDRISDAHHYVKTVENIYVYTTPA